MKLKLSDLRFEKYSGETLPRYFKFDEEDSDLVEFYDEDAKKLQEESMVMVYNVYYGEQFVGYFAYAASEIKYTNLHKEHKLALFSHPALKLGRLLVCKSMRRMGIGKHILTHFMSIAIRLKEEVAIKFLVVDSLPEAVDFYKKFGFIDFGVKTGRGRENSLLYINISKLV